MQVVLAGGGLVGHSRAEQSRAEQSRIEGRSLTLLRDEPLREKKARDGLHSGAGRRQTDGRTSERAEEARDVEASVVGRYMYGVADAGCQANVR